MRTRETYALAFAALLAIPPVLSAQQAAARPAAKPAASEAAIVEVKAGLRAKARISGAAAVAAARGVVPQGSTFSKGRLEEEDGKLTYALQFMLAGKSEITEIHVDALTGSVETEDKDVEAHEKSGTQQCRRNEIRPGQPALSFS